MWAMCTWPDGYQAPGGLQFDSDGKLRPVEPSGYRDEMAGYQAQYSFKPNSLVGGPNSFNKINIKYLGNILKENGEPMYPELNKAWNNLSPEQKKEYD